VAGEQVALTPERLRKLEAIEHVAAVVPYLDRRGRASFRDKTEVVVRCTAAPPGDAHHQGRIVAGRLFNAADGRAVVVSEYLLDRWGVRDDAEVLTQPVRLEFRTGPAPDLVQNLLNPGGQPLTALEEQSLERALHKLPDARIDGLEPDERGALQRLLKAPGVPGPGEPFVETFTIVGVLRGPAPDDGLGPWPWLAGTEDVVLSPKAAEEVAARFPGARGHRFDQAAVIVDSEEHVKEVVKQVAAEGLGYFALVDFLERVQRNVLLVAFAMGFVALVALLVAALGIINTMLMTVLERTHEIGVMKAVGARDGHVQVIFLVEGAVIGLAGGCVGLLLGWLASFPGDAVARSLMEEQAQAPFTETVFAFPWWLVLGMPLFTGLVATLAAVLPARRAARVSPITALRHE
jgi:putative ABC transport system permease protein